MARMYVREGSYTASETAYECQEFYLKDALDYQDTTHAGLKIIVRSGDLTNPFVGIRMSGTASSFPVTDGGESFRVDLWDFDEMVAPFVPDIKLGVNIKKSPDDEFGNVTWINPKPVTKGVKPADWDTNWDNYYWVDVSNRWMPNGDSTWYPTVQYYHPGDHLKMMYVADGLKRFKFGVATRLSYYYASDAWYRNVPYSGMRRSYTIREYIGDDMDTLNFQDTQGNYLVRNDSNINIQHSQTPSPTLRVPAGTQSIFAQSYPVHFVIPAGTHIGSKGLNGEMSTQPSSSFTPTKNTAFFGVLTVSYDYDGFPTSWCITAMESTVWKSATRRQNDFGEDTTPTGGHGPQKVGKYNPYSMIDIHQNAGIVRDPTAGKGLVIYKMDGPTFQEFIGALYEQRAMPAYVSNALASLLGGTSQVQDAMLALSWGLGNVGKSTLENIVFVKNSPVSFPSKTWNLNRITIGNGGITKNFSEYYTVDVVTQNVVFKEIEKIYDNNANSFTDLEPYKTASIYCPLVGEMQIMPSYLENATIFGHIGYNLLNDSAVCALQIQGDNGVIRVSKSGQCAKAADTVLYGDGSADALTKLIPAAAVGAATIATGGTTAPALATTAVGAATGFVQDSTTMSVVNVPSSSTGNAYEECVYGGLRSMYITSIKSERFASGENVSGTNMRAKVIGQYSYQYVGSISEISQNEFASFSDVDLKMGSGMTKAEYDKIMSYLHEGVYI